MAKTLNDYLTEARQVVREVTPAEVDELAAQGYRLIDVREPEEFEAGHPVHFENLPRGWLEVKADLEHPKRDETYADRTQRFVCFCGGGHRSLLAAKVLLEMGFADAVSVNGGWRRWVEEGRPVVP